MRNKKTFTTHTQHCHPELVSGSCSKIADQARNDKRIRGFTLIELLVVVLIIAILGAIALPKYMITRDRARLSGLMTIGKNVNDALDRQSLITSAAEDPGLDVLDISFNDNTGSDCTGTYCRITVSGKDYRLYPRLNIGGTQGNNITRFYSYTDTSFAIFEVYTNEYSSSWGYMLDCSTIWANVEVTIDTARCLKIGASLGGSCNSNTCYFN